MQTSMSYRCDFTVENTGKTCGQGSYTGCEEGWLIQQLWLGWRTAGEGFYRPHLPLSSPHFTLYIRLKAFYLLQKTTISKLIAKLTPAATKKASSSSSSDSNDGSQAKVDLLHGNPFLMRCSYLVIEDPSEGDAEASDSSCEKGFKQFWLWRWTTGQG